MRERAVIDIIDGEIVASNAKHRVYIANKYLSFWYFR